MKKILMAWMCAVLAGCASTPSTNGPLSIADQGYFYVGGKYTKTKDGQISVGQMFVQYQIPETRKHPYPVVMWHGGGQTGTNFLGTPDGRKGWAEHFLRQGYAVYVVDQPARGRSGYYTDVYGPTRRPNTAAMSSRFTAPERVNQYPQAKFHTQWPGEGVAGDPIFDQFFASQVEDMNDVGAIEEYNRAAGAALLDKIGPAILLTHSQSGPFGWVLANDRSKLVKGVIAIEPSGGPKHDVVLTPGQPNFYRDGSIVRGWGVTRTPMTYQPEADTQEALNLVRQAKADGPSLSVAGCSRSQRVRCPTSKASLYSSW